MKFWKKYGKGFLALMLIVTLIGGVSAVPGVFAENQVGSTDNTATVADETEGSEDTEECEQAVGTEYDDLETTNIAEETEKYAVDLQEGVDVEKLYDMTVEFDGKKLVENTDNDSLINWENQNTKSMKITLTKKTGVNADTNKNYIVSIKVPDKFYFSGLPNAEQITGVEKVEFVKNVCPKVYNSTGEEVNLPGFSQYSGEMRLLLNSGVPTITITNIGINYNKELIGYSGNKQIVSDPIEVSFETVGQGTELKEISDEEKDVLTEYKIANIGITTASISGSGMKNTLSNDGFVTVSANEQNIYIGKSGTVSYAGGAAGQNDQVYKSLTIVFSCPYITIDNKKYYLKLTDKADTALTGNTQGNKSGYHMSQNAVYDENMHTVTYSFSNIYLGGHTPIFYSPRFSWPDELQNMTIDQQYKVEGGNWSISEQTCLTGASATLKNSFSPSTYFAYFTTNNANVTLYSSAEAPSDKRMAKRAIYSGITRNNGIQGTLGFFDVHNDGALDSPAVNISFEFNTGEEDKATYYITQVNLPVYNNENGTDVTYTLSNGTEEKSGTYHYTNSESFYCKVSVLRTACGASSDYYIKSLSYTTTLQKGKAYHMETAHLWRNRPTDSGIYFGYLEGVVGATAHAVMSIESTDKKSELNSTGAIKLSATETSTIAENNYIAYSLPKMKIDGSTTSAITAGESAKLQFGATVNNEEYSIQNGEQRTVNGYHVFENGEFYVCLPDGISIGGTEQVEVVKGNNTKISASSVKRLDDTKCTVNDQTAYWWKIEVPDIKATTDQTIWVDVQLDTKIELNDLSWNFQNCVAVRAKGQYISWGAAGNYNSIYNESSEISKSNLESVKSLGNYLGSQSDATNLGLSIYSRNVDTSITIARAEAKLDVDTGIEVGADTVDQEAAFLSDLNSDISYNVTVSSQDNGHADNFSYYVPIVSEKSAIDSNMLVSRNEFNLSLQQAVKITKLKSESQSDIPFTVYYTTDQNLTSDTIVNASWVTEPSDFSSVTAVKIVTNEKAMIKAGENYQFSLKLKYDNASSDFEQMAGSIVEWRSFGKYTYVRNDASTTNTYPSPRNRITIKFNKNFVESPLKVYINTDAEQNKANAELLLNEKFANEQIFVVKNVKTTGIQLRSDDPQGLTGTKANEQFHITFNMNNMEGKAATLLSQGSSSEKQWTIAANAEIKLQAEVLFSTALTETALERYVDVTIGNENVDITFRIQLIRSVKPANANGSGVTDGAHYQVPDRRSECAVGQKSAFTALYVLNFVPGNYTGQVLKWKSTDNTSSENVFPKNTKITMMEISDQSKVNSFWYYKTEGTETTGINLHQFKRMSGSDTYTYDCNSATSQTIRYMFVIDFSEAEVTAGSYQIIWEAEPESTNTSVEKLSYPFNVTVDSEKEYGLSCVTDEQSSSPKAQITYTVSDFSYDSYINNKTLSLVLKPSSNNLPKDAKLVSGENKYIRNSQGNYIIPIGSIQSGSQVFTLESDMFPDEEKTYTLEAQLYLSNSAVAASPMNGTPVGGVCRVDLKKADVKRPALRVTGTRIAAASEWGGSGQNISIDMKNIADGKLTVTAYSGLTGSQKVTDLLSSVSGIFKINSGVGTYDTLNKSTGKLVLNSSAKPGTYRLVFEVKDDRGQTVMTVPYYIIVK